MAYRAWTWLNDGSDLFINKKKPNEIVNYKKWFDETSKGMNPKFGDFMRLCVFSNAKELEQNETIDEWIGKMKILILKCMRKYRSRNKE